MAFISESYYSAEAIDILAAIQVKSSMSKLEAGIFYYSFNYCCSYFKYW